MEEEEAGFGTPQKAPSQEDYHYLICLAIPLKSHIQGLFIWPNSESAQWEKY